MTGQFVRTKHGLMMPDQAKALARFEKSRQQARVDAARERIEIRAAALGLDLAMVRRLWKNGQKLLERRLAEVRRIVSKPRPEIERAYPCAGCRVLHDDSYKAACAAKKLSPCFMRTARGPLKGCPGLVPRGVVAGFVAVSATPKPLLMAPAVPPIATEVAAAG